MSGLASTQTTLDRMAENSRGTVIVVAHNNLHLTKEAVRTARAQDNNPNVILVDNFSTDGTLAWARTQPDLLRVTFADQKSLSACWNYALKMIWQKNKCFGACSIAAPHALIINNDVELRPDTYQKLVHHGGQFVTAVSVDSADRLYCKECNGKGVVCDYVGLEMRPVGVPCPTCSTKSAPRPHPDFSCFLIRRECYEKVGEFDESYWPAYCEDCDYHVRMHRAGIEAVCIDLPFLHHGAQTIKHADPAAQAVIRRGADKNRERFRKTYGCLPGTKEYEALFH